MNGDGYPGWVKALIVGFILAITGVSGAVTGAWGDILDSVCDWMSDQPAVDNEAYQDDQDRIKDITCTAAGMMP